MACGVAAHVAALNIPDTELIVAVSVLIAGGLLALDRPIAVSAWAAIFSIAGFFHGYAFGESIYGAESTPLAAYLVGLVAVQTALVVALAIATRVVWKASGITPRFVGAAICGVGFTVLVGQIIPTPWVNRRKLSRLAVAVRAMHVLARAGARCRIGLCSWKCVWFVGRITSAPYVHVKLQRMVVRLRSKRASG